MLTFRRKRELKLSQRRVLIDSIKIGLASPTQIQKWAERELPNGKKTGKVANPKTVDYKTLKPVKDGLFCERIFGPVKDFVCACGKRQAGSKSRFCNECEVEWASCRTRRYRLGYIDLASPVTHVWYIKGRPNYIATLLGEKQRLVEGIAYCTKFVLGEAVLNGSGGIERPSKTGEKSGAEIVNKRERFTVSPDNLYRALETAQPPLSLFSLSLQSDGPGVRWPPPAIEGVAIETPKDSTSAAFISASGFASNPLGEDINVASTPSNTSTNISPVLSFQALRSSSLPIFAVQTSLESLGLYNSLPVLTVTVPGEANILGIASVSSIRDYPNDFSKKVPISKTFCTDKRLSPVSLNCIQCQSISDARVSRKVSLPSKTGKEDLSLPVVSKRPNRFKGTTYLSFGKKDLGNGARGALKEKSWKGLQMVKDWRDTPPYNGFAAVKGEAPKILQGQGVYTRPLPRPGISNSYKTPSNSRLQQKLTDLLPFSLKQSSSNKSQHMGTYSKKQTMPLSFAFAREPDERSQLLEFLYSPVANGDLAIPLYNVLDSSISKARFSQNTSRFTYTLQDQPWVNALGLTHLNSKTSSQIEDRQLFLRYTNTDPGEGKAPSLGRKAVENSFLSSTLPRSGNNNGDLNAPLLPAKEAEESLIKQPEETLRNAKTIGDDGSWFILGSERVEAIGSLSGTNVQVPNFGFNVPFQNQKKANTSWDPRSLPLQARLIESIRDDEASEMVVTMGFDGHPRPSRGLDLENKIKDKGKDPLQASQPVDINVIDNDPEKGEALAMRPPTGVRWPPPLSLCRQSERGGIFTISNAKSGRFVTCY